MVHIVEMSGAHDVQGERINALVRRLVLLQILFPFPHY